MARERKLKVGARAPQLGRAAQLLRVVEILVGLSAGVILMQKLDQFIVAMTV